MRRFWSGQSKGARQASTGERSPLDIGDLSRRGLMAGVIATSTSLGGCLGNTSLNYRLAIHLLIDGQQASGSSIRRLTWHKGGGFWGWMDVDAFRTGGEAVVMPVGAQSLLFATLAFKRFNEQLNRWFISGLWLPVAPFERAFGGDIDAWARRRGERVPLLPEEYPLLVSFRDPGDPLSVFEVAPDDVSRAFGSSVKFHSMTVEVVQGAVTRGQVRKSLPWVDKIEGTLNGGPSGGSDAIYDNLYIHQLVLRNG